MRRGIVYGSSTAPWQLSDADFSRLYQREAAILFTEDDLLWYRLRLTPHADLDFTYGDRIVGFGEHRGMLVLGARLVWDEGSGMDGPTTTCGGLTDSSTRHPVRDCRGRRAAIQRAGRAWIVANEVLDSGGLRTDVPWYQTIGPSYVAEAFEIVRDTDHRRLDGVPVDP